MRAKLPKIFFKKQELFRENNCIKYGRGSKAIKFKEYVYISKHKVQGTESMNRQFIWEKVNSWAYKKIFYPDNNRNAHQSSSEVSIHSCYNNKTWKIREPKPKAEQIVAKCLCFAGGTGYIIGFGTCFGSAFLSLEL